MFTFITKMLLRLLSFNGSLASMSNASIHPCVGKHTLIDSNPNEYNKRINELKTLTKSKWYESKCNVDIKKCNLNQEWDNDKCYCGCKNKKTIMCAKMVIFGILLIVLLRRVNIWQVLLTA